MKSLTLILFLAVAGGLIGQTSQAPVVQGQTVVHSAANPSNGLSEDQLDQLVGPIALYPDALVALILPAATEPTEVVLAARYLAAKGPADQIDAQPWSESVKSLARYAEVVAWMDANLGWTQQMGAAFAAEPAGVLNAVQRMRGKARALGTLTDTPEQRVVVEDQAIRIEPVYPSVIYVPYYDPAVVYYSRPFGLRSSYIRFSSGYATGSWLFYSCDWYDRRVVVLNRHYRSPGYGTPYPVYTRNQPHPGFQPWNPRPNRHPRPSVIIPPGPNQIQRPMPLPGAPRPVDPIRMRPDRGQPPRRLPPNPNLNQPGQTPIRPTTPNRFNSPGASSPSQPPPTVINPNPQGGFVRPQNRTQQLVRPERGFPATRRADPPSTPPATTPATPPASGFTPRDAQPSRTR